MCRGGSLYNFSPIMHNQVGSFSQDNLCNQHVLLLWGSWCVGFLAFENHICGAVGGFEHTQNNNLFLFFSNSAPLLWVSVEASLESTTLSLVRKRLMQSSNIPSIHVMLDIFGGMMKSGCISWETLRISSGKVRGKKSKSPNWNLNTYLTSRYENQGTKIRH